MSYKLKRKAHAKHNEQAAEFIRGCQSGDFSDWVMIALFYAAYHHVLGAMFPLKRTESRGKTSEYSTFDSIYNDDNAQNLGKHEFASMLVSENLPDISSFFDHMKQLSWNLRYKHHQANPQDLSTCLDYAKKIQAVCLPK